MANLRIQSISFSNPQTLTFGSTSLVVNPSGISDKEILLFPGDHVQHNTTSYQLFIQADDHQSKIVLTDYQKKEKTTFVLNLEGLIANEDITDIDRFLN